MNVATGLFVAAEDEHAIDETHHWLWPETPEMIYGGIAFVVVLLLFWKLGVFKMIAKGLSDRTAKIQQQLDDSAGARKAAETEAAEIRKAAGDIDSERERLLAAAGVQAEELLVDGRARLETEVAELQARADAEIASASSRSGDELQGEIARLSGAAAERLVVSTLDDATQQRLIEDFIARVGAS
jgi:F-type H+-transporting ATPase subunit b